MVITNPPGSDQLSTADDHLRLIKKAVKQSFPNVGSEVSASAGELNRVVGLTSTIEQQANRSASDGYASLDSNRKVPLDLMHPTVLRKDTAATVSASWTFSGAVTFTGDLTGVSAKIEREARTSNTILGLTDNGKLIDITSGTFSQTFDAAATLDSGWFVYIRNSGSGDITLDPNGSETIDGLTTFVMYPGEVRLIQCDGSALRSFVIKGFSRTFTSSGTFTKPPGYTEYGGLVWSGGSSGARSGGSEDAFGGGGGGCYPFTLPASLFGATETITVGAGGAAVTSVADGNVGGDSSIGSILTVKGAPIWNAGGSFEGPDGAVVTTSDEAILLTGFAGAGGAAARDTQWGGANSGTSSTVQAGGSSVWGGASGGGFDSATGPKAGGTSRYGGDGGAGSDTSNGTDGTAPGGGGGATQTGTQSGAGARGEIRIWGLV